MMKVSFDYDGTLFLTSVEEYAKELVQRGIEVWVVTSRVGDDDTENDFQPWKSPNWNEDLWESCDRIGIPKERVKFTSFKDKIEFLEGKDFLFHLDDDLYELTAIMESGDSCKPVNVNHFEWRETCEEILKIKK
jgi:hypothetical protein